MCGLSSIPNLPRESLKCTQKPSAVFVLPCISFSQYMYQSIVIIIKHLKVASWAGLMPRMFSSKFSKDTHLETSGSVIFYVQMKKWPSTWLRLHTVSWPGSKITGTQLYLRASSRNPPHHLSYPSFPRTTTRSKKSRRKPVVFNSLCWTSQSAGTSDKDHLLILCLTNSSSDNEYQL